MNFVIAILCILLCLKLNNLFIDLSRLLDGEFLDNKASFVSALPALPTHWELNCLWNKCSIDTFREVY